MMKFLVALFLFVGSASAQCDCGPDGSEFFMAGSSTVEPIAKLWKEGYEALCPGRKVNETGGGSSVGARRVCNSTGGSAVEIGNMSREWRTSEANLTDAANGKYQCVFGNRTRSVTQVPVAIDGITTVVITGGMAGRCLRNATGAGLSIDQLRWMFTNYTNAQLIQSGWDASSIPNSDGNEATHLWSEIHNSALCKPIEVKLCSPGTLSGTYDFFKEQVLPNSTEGLANKRPNPTFTSELDEELVDFIKLSSVAEYGDAIGYFGYAYYAEAGQIFYGIPIKAKNAEVWVTPNDANIESGAYVPFSRRIYMNVLDSSFDRTAPFIQYGFNQKGTSKIRRAGFVPIPEKDRPTFLARVGSGLNCVITPDVPTPAPTRPPVPGVPVAPVAPTAPVPAGTPTGGREPCGLLGLSIFCPLTLCGFFGRLFGLCSE